MAERSAAEFRTPRPIGSPVLESILPVIASSQFVQTNVQKIREHAAWLAYEELPFPQFMLPLGFGRDREETINFAMVAGLLNFAFTDFESRIRFEVEYRGEKWSDAEAMFACLKRAMDDGIPVLDGACLARITRSELAGIFRGNIEIPMLEERTAILRETGAILEERYEGKFHRFLATCPPRLYDNGAGIIERMAEEFPRCRDVSRLDGMEVKFYKLSQLAVWMLHATLRDAGGFPVEDLDKMTAFADYVVPMALRLMGILSYEQGLEQRIASRQPIARDSREEIEIRAHTIYATALLREEINLLRPSTMQVIIPQVDARLWTHYHTTFWPHHLTRTIMY